MNIDYTKLKKLKEEDLKVGMVVIGGKNVSGCWKLNNGDIVPFRIDDLEDIHHTSLDGSRKMTCSCSDLDNLYLFEEQTGQIKIYEDENIIIYKKNKVLELTKEEIAKRLGVADFKIKE